MARGWFPRRQDLIEFRGCLVCSWVSRLFVGVLVVFVLTECSASKVTTVPSTAVARRRAVDTAWTRRWTQSWTRRRGAGRRGRHPPRRPGCHRRQRSAPRPSPVAVYVPAPADGGVHRGPPAAGSWPAHPRSASSSVLLAPETSAVLVPETSAQAHTSEIAVGEYHRPRRKRGAAGSESKWRRSSSTWPGFGGLSFTGRAGGHGRDRGGCSRHGTFS